ncbi:benzoate transporter [Streptomyces sp. NPDC048196]|uniref:WD40 repeat domain-containing protein n=1 Tax=Streptomyces sp. NPDC048196 TaxID=3154712 RepID=UPI0033D711F3
MSGRHPGAHHGDIHRQIAGALAALVTDDATIPPHPYLSRHLAQHAAYGNVLNDAHVPPALLPWESSAAVRRLLHHQDTPQAEQSWLTAWAALEPFLNSTDPTSRLASLHLAHHAAAFRRIPPSQLPTTSRLAGSRVSPLWSDCAPPDSIWSITDHRIEALAHVTTPAGRHVLVSGDEHGTVRFWRPDGTPAATAVHTDGGAVQHLLPLQDGLLAAGSTDGTVRIVDTARGRLISQVHHRPRTWVSSLILYTPAGHPPVLLAAHSDGHLAALNTATYRPIDLPLPVLPPAPALLTGVAPPDADGTLLVIAQDHTVSQWDGRSLTTRTHHNGQLRAIIALPATGHYATGDESGALAIWDLSAPDSPAAQSPTLHAGAITALATCTADGHPAIASAGTDGTVRLWHANTALPIGDALQGHALPVTALTGFTPHGRARLITSSADNTVRSWPLTGHTARPARPAWRRINAAAMPATHTHKPLLAVATEDGLKVWNIHTGHSRTVPVGEMPTALHWTCIDGTLVLAAAHSDASITLHPLLPDAATAGPLPTLTGHALPVTALTTLTDQTTTLLATGSADGTVRLWNLLTHRQLAVFRDHRLSVRTLAVLDTADGPLLASGGTDGNLRLWDPVTRAQHGATVRCGQHTINAVAAGPHHQGIEPLIATAGQDGTVRLWNLTSTGLTANPVRLAPEDGPLTALTCLHGPAQRTFLAAAGRSSIHLWDAATGTPLLRLVTGQPTTSLSAHLPSPDTTPSSPCLMAVGDAGVRVFRLDLDQT